MLLGGRAGFVGVNPFPIIGARIHPPLLRADTLTRDRLNAWLDEAATGRVALVVAEAGFGKTTLLGDWARNSERLTAWYRLDPDDRDWLTFCRHLVASGRELDPEFAPDTYALLLRLGPGGPTRADIEASLVREYAEFGASHPQGLTLIFDDYHVVDGSDEVVPIVRALIDRTGPGFSIVIAARSTPQLPLGRLRARGAVSRISGEALCFDVPETDRLFRDAYRMPIDPDVVDELVQRTEGWAALLSLVNVTLGEQSHRDARTLVAQLSATEGDLYDYLAEEVVVGLDPALHSFLKRVSVLTSIDAASACLVTDDDAISVSESIAKAESIGLLAKPDRESAHRFHPLVRAFLLVQLVADIGEKRLLEMHAKLGRSFEPTDWASSAWHYRASGDPDAAARVVDSAIEEIFAAGQFERARPFMDGSAGSRDRPGALILRSRLELTRGNHEQASALAHQAITLTPETPLASQALLNASSIDGFGGIEDASAQYAEEALRANQTKSQQSIARATIAMWQAGRDGRLDLIAEGLRDLVAEQDLAGHYRYAGITRLNLAGVLLWLGDVRDAASTAARAQVDLGGFASGSAEYAAAVAAEAKSVARLGHLDRAEALIAAVLDLPSRLGRDEACAEAAEIKVDFGDVESAASLLGLGARSKHVAQYANLVGGGLALRRGDLSAAASFARELVVAPCTDIAGLMRGQVLRTRAAVLSMDPEADRELEALQQLATAQRSRPGAITADLLRAVIRDESIHSEVVRLHPDETYVLSQLAEEISHSLHKLSPEASDAVRAEALRRPARWATALRLCLECARFGHTSRD